MSSSFDFREPDHFTAGAVGEPGQRVFYLQAREEGVVVSLRLEKQQVEALAEYLAGILNDLPEAGGDPPFERLELMEPVVAEWIVGSLGVAYDETDDRLVLVAEEAVDEEAGEEAVSARFRITRPQVAAFVDHARELVSAGRPPCPICGRPLDPGGHVCPRSNGHTRPAS